VYATGLRQGFYAAMVFLGALIGQAWGLQGVAVGVLIALAIHFVLMVDLCIDLTAMSWRAFLLALLPAVMMTAVLGCETWLLSEFLRSHEMPPLMLLLICVGTLGGTVLVILASAGKALLGEDGRWLLQAIVARLKKNPADAT
ncbi:MAG: lipopolysaccharide biosynthesis protein, partial [Geminicoccaceae bacterium]